MGFLRLLEECRIPILNEFMLLITRLGEETVFLVAALVLFWCIDKRRGYYILSVGFLGTLANQFMKLFFRIPRPWILDENFTILEQAREAASGYSFPSGHTQSAVGTFGGIACTTNHRLTRYACIAIALLVPFSRMYVGVHTPADVLTAAAMAVILIVVFCPVSTDRYKSWMPVLLPVMLICSVAFLCYVSFTSFPSDIDTHNLESGIKNAYTLLGALVGLIVVYICDEKWLNFDTNAIWWAQICKVVLGLLIVLAVKAGLKAPLNALLGENIGRAVRYFLIVIAAGIVWPLTFRYFGKLGKKEKT